jgi:hypothetical protein
VRHRFDVFEPGCGTVDEVKYRRGGKQDKSKNQKETHVRTWGAAAIN